MSVCFVYFTVTNLIIAVSSQKTEFINTTTLSQAHDTCNYLYFIKRKEGREERKEKKKKKTRESEKIDLAKIISHRLEDYLYLVMEHSF